MFPLPSGSSMSRLYVGRRLISGDEMETENIIVQETFESDRTRYIDGNIYHITATQLMMVFLLGGITGTILETFWVLALTSNLQWRSGLILVPIHPIYAVGALLMTICLRPLYRFKYRHAAVFFGAAVIGSSFEFLASLIQSVLFRSNSWEYSQQPLNLGGRTSLSMAIIWGVLGLFWMMLALPRLLKLIDLMEPRIMHRLAGFGLCLFLSAAIISVVAVIRWEMRESGYAGTSAFGTFIDMLFPDRIMTIFYPTLKFIPR